MSQANGALGMLRPSSAAPRNRALGSRRPVRTPQVSGKQHSTVSTEVRKCSASARSTCTPSYRASGRVALRRIAPGPAAAPDGLVIMWPAHHISRCTGWTRALADGTFDRLVGLSGLVTGAAHGIGEACAAELASRGARVLLADRDEEALAEAAERIAAAGGEVATHPVDVREWASVEAL